VSFLLKTKSWVLRAKRVQQLELISFRGNRANSIVSLEFVTGITGFSVDCDMISILYIV
jgi:hypothetical protein